MPGYSSEWTVLSRQYRASLVDPVCAYCGLGIDMDLNPRDAWSLTVDHILPKAYGGEDDLDNMQPMHRSCNTKRMHDWRRAGGWVGAGVRTSREW